ncbi:hypothetical protein MKX01_036339 [Papaver californicum]|nr:hypothetical protein MKX01_036339 [Papaver californicum]
MMMSGKLNNSSCRSASGLDTDGEFPYKRLLFALSYLNVQDLMSVEMVCRFFRSTVQGNAFLWKDIHIDRPALSKWITDDALLRLTNRAQGNLRTLSLVKCCKITDDGLKRLLERNQRLIKLNVPGCTALTVEGIVKTLENFQSTNTPPGIKQLRVGERYDVKKIDFEKLMSLMAAAEDCRQKSNVKNPRFYQHCYSLPCDDDDDDCAMDIEVCPRCQMFRKIYDCPAESCQGKKVESQLCRGCRFCISRCYQCGRCINDIENEETFILEPLCSDCCKQVMV